MLLHRFEFWRQEISPQWSQQVCSWNISDRYSGPVPFSDLWRSSSAWKSILWRAVSKRKDLRIRVEWSVCSVYVRTAAAAWGRLVFSGRPIKRLLQLLNLPEIKAWMSFFIAMIAQIQKPWTATSQTHFLNFPVVLFVFLEITSYYVRVIITRKHLLFSRDNEIILWRSQDTKLGDSKQTSYCPVDYNLFVGRWKRNYQHLCVFESYA